MKRIFFYSAMALLIVGCGNSENKTETSTTTPATEATAEAPADPVVAKGLQLVAQSDCFQCHKVAEKLTGPAYEEVAAKYPNNQQTIDTLAQKIIKGGVGVWGPVPMTAHPDLSKEDAETMVKYILSLKK